MYVTPLRRFGIIIRHFLEQDREGGEGKQQRKHGSGSNPWVENEKDKCEKMNSRLTEKCEKRSERYYRGEERRGGDVKP